MKLLVSWLQEWLHNKDSAVANIVTSLTSLGFDTVLHSSEKFADQLVIGQIVSLAPHPNADKLQVCQVAVDDSGQLLQIICGCSSIYAGLKAPVAMIGTVLPAVGVKIKKSKIRGVESQGMLCSSRELGIDGATNQILHLDKNVTVGMQYQDYLGGSDDVLDIEITPNRGDCLSVLGLARDMSSSTGNAYLYPFVSSNKPPEVGVKKKQDNLKIVVDRVEDCQQYRGILFAQVDNSLETPDWMQKCLLASGIKTVSIMVDILNYVMLELGQPMHAFDYNKIDANSLCVRRANQDEELILLNGESIKLDAEVLTIADKQGLLAIAGVIGGQFSAIDKHTKDILVECAHFDAKLVAKICRKYQLSTEASYRFERGVDGGVDYINVVINRLIELVVKYTQGKPVLIEHAVPRLDAVHRKIVLRLARIKRVLGWAPSEQALNQCWQRSAFAAKQVAGGWQLTVPTYRHDIQSEIDLIEEVARLFNYDTIPVQNYHAVFEHIADNRAILRQYSIKDSLLYRGYQEIISYSFISELEQNLSDPEHKPVNIINPINDELNTLRTSLWPGLIWQCKYNINRQKKNFKLFEMGVCYEQENEKKLETTKLSGIWTGSVSSEHWAESQKNIGFMDIKIDCDMLLNQSVFRGKFQYVPAVHAALHPHQSAKICFKNDIVGWIGLLHPKLVTHYELPLATAVFELDNKIFDLERKIKVVCASKYPSIRRDISFIAPKTVEYGCIYKEIKRNCNKTLKDIVLFDIYISKDFADGFHSISIGLVFQHDDRTLQDGEVDDCVGLIVNKLTTNLGFEEREKWGKH